MKRIEIKPVEALSQRRWHSLSSLIRNSLLALFLSLTAAFSLVSCRTQYIPLETNTEIHYVDSTIWNIKDSVRITEATRYRDFSWIGDTLRLRGNRSRAWAVADTLKGAIIGEIEEDPVEEKTKIAYKTELKIKDSIKVVEKPVPVEVEKKVIPKWSIYSLIFGILCLLIEGIRIYIKFRK